jgi:hypothetical protein
MTNDTQTLLEELRRLSAGLFYRSETDAPFEPVHFPAPPTAPSPPELAAWAEQPADADVETVELDWFLRNLVQEQEEADQAEKQQAVRFQELANFLKQHLAGVRVYRVGRRKIAALLLGTTPAGDYAGLKTTLVET